MVQPICLGGLLSYFSPIKEFKVTLNEAYWYATGIVLSNAFTLIAYHPFDMWKVKMAGLLRTSCSGLVYRKALRLSKSQVGEGENGRITNLLSNDISKIDSAIRMINYVWNGPLETLVFATVIYIEVGISALVGITFLASFIPLQGNFDFFFRVFIASHFLI